MTSESDRNTTVFIVDDESAMRDALSLVAQAMGLSAKCFSSAGEFLEFIDPYDISGPVCLIADVQMPAVNGIGLLEQLNASGREFPVIMTTGHGDKALKHKAEQLGAAAFLEKPFRPAELKEFIATSLKQNVGEKDTP